MKKLYVLIFSLISTFIFGQDLTITGVFDGPLSGGTPKAIELYVINNIADLSVYGIGSANNGGGTDGIEFFFSGSATAGDFLYVASEQPQFNVYFGFDPNFVSGMASINGDDAIELFGSVVDNGDGTFSGTVIDIYGDINVNGDGEVWDYSDGWGYRNDNTGSDGSTFVSGNWSYSGINANDDQTTNATATTPFPLGTYSLSTASIRENNIEGLRVYPNPVSNGILRINSFDNAQKSIRIYDLLGKQVLSKIMTTKELNVSRLNTGVYILKISENGKTATRKLVIK